MDAIETHGLTRRYGRVLAVDHVSFTVRRGEVFGFLGPNGAGKSTTVRMLTGYVSPSEGSALLDGHDILTDSLAARSRLGVVPEEANVYVDLTVWQNVMLMAELHGVPRTERTRRGTALLELFELAERRGDQGRALSKGLRQRLMLCMALVSEPAILFLDEPTTGLDVASARLIRETIGRLNRERGVTVFLTTHNLEEANQLCHRLAIIHRGRIAAIDTPQALRGAIESRRSVEVVFTAAPHATPVVSDPGAVVEIFAGGAGIRVYTPMPGAAAQEVATWATECGVDIESISTRGPSLEDVFLSLTATASSPREGPVGARD
ncbi:MAG: ABC transporter ATP-binding protein [Candidatus Rokubacteria bacterium]|nr:ABC transporter ATP-binding protein [Candidatus Rokubacteria bacterium]